MLVLCFASPPFLFATAVAAHFFGKPKENPAGAAWHAAGRAEIQAQNLGVLVSSYWSPRAAAGGGSSDFAGRLTPLSGIGAGLWGAFAAAVSNIIMGPL